MVSAASHPASTMTESASDNIGAVNVLKANEKQAVKDLYHESEFDKANNKTTFRLFNEM